MSSVLNRSVSFRFLFPGPGLFQCSLTGLVFDVTRESEVTYKTLIWDPLVLQPAHKVAGGPLFGIECPRDSIRQLHLPHCEPEPGKDATETPEGELNLQKML